MTQPHICMLQVLLGAVRNIRSYLANTRSTCGKRRCKTLPGRQRRHIRNGIAKKKEINAVVTRSAGHRTMQNSPLIGDLEAFIVECTALDDIMIAREKVFRSTGDLAEDMVKEIKDAATSLEERIKVINSHLQVARQTLKLKFE